MKFSSYINGKFIETKNNINIYSPENNKLLGTIPALDKSDIDLAFNSAKSAFKEWSSLTPYIRAEYILNFASLLKKNKLILIDILSSEIAKSINDTSSEIDRTIDYIIETVHHYLDFFEKPLYYSENNSLNFPKNKYAIYLPTPHGVAVTISPFNFPVNLALSKIIPALITGNTVIHKSATNGSLTGSFLAKLFHETQLKDNTKLPPGVFNYVTGKGSSIGDYLYQHKLCNIISFTGSSEIGYKIASHFPMKPYSLELGGNNAAIILEDADLETTSDQIIKGAFNYSGQRCTSTKRVYIHKKIEKKFLEIFLKKVQSLSVGLAKDNAYITSVINNQKVEQIKEYYEEAISLGAVSLTGNLKIEENLIYPVVLTNVPNNTKIMQKEQFAPIIPFCVFEDINVMLKLHNQNDYGLQSDIFTTNINEAKRIAELLETAVVNINSSGSRGPDILPFTGFKKSGFNTQGIIESLKFFFKFKGTIYNNFSYSDISNTYK